MMRRKRLDTEALSSYPEKAFYPQTAGKKVSPAEERWTHTRLNGRLWMEQSIF